MTAAGEVRVVPLDYVDEALAQLELPGGTLAVTRGLGSGLSRGADGRLWAIGDRGPNLKVGLAIERYGLSDLQRHAATDGAKVMPCPGIGPAISELRIDGDRVTIVRTLPLRDRAGRALSGVPAPGSLNDEREPALTLDGSPIPPDPSGVDSEGIAAMADGSFWIGDEYGPSLLRVAADGAVVMRWVPAGSEDWFAGADYPVEGRLPAIAARRRLNRGFEAVALSTDERRLYLAFQSPLAHPDLAAHRAGRTVRLWALDAETGAVAAHYAYPLDDPTSFRRDVAAGPVDWSDLKVSELVTIGPDSLLVLERGSASTKIYAVDLDPALALDPSHLAVATRPTVEQSRDLPVLTKRLILDTDHLPQIGADIEGMALLSPRALLLVNDNDFGIEGVATRFWRVELAEDLVTS